MKRKFIETHIFTRLIDHIGRRDLEKLIKEALLENPKTGAVIKDTGGLRKVRVSKPGMGKSGGYRVIYLDLPENETIYLYLIYEKSVSDDIPPDKKRLIRKDVERLKNEIKKGHKR